MPPTALDAMARSPCARAMTGKAFPTERPTWSYCPAASDDMSTAAKILLIEDDVGISETLRQVLIEEGHEVAVEKRGDDGLARADSDSFNVVITDLRLPGLNGLELVRQLHAARPRLPIILITAFGTTQTAIEATKFGAYDYLLKPFNMPDMIALVRKAADSNRLMSEPVILGEPGAARSSVKARPCRPFTRRSDASPPSRSTCSSAAKPARARN